MSIEVKRPSGEIVDDIVGLVLFNHLGSTVSQYTGRDAQFIADRFGIAVIAADRPGTHGIIPSAGRAETMSDPEGYSDEVAKVGELVNTHLEKIGIEKTIVAGRSAAGLGALALTACQVIESQRALFVAEPVGCEPMSVEEAKGRVKQYANYQKKLQTTGPNIIKPVSDDLPLSKRLSRLVHMVLDYKFDVFHNQYIWATDASLQYAIAIPKQNDVFVGMLNG